MEHSVIFFFADTESILGLSWTIVKTVSLIILGYAVQMRVLLCEDWADQFQEYLHHNYRYENDVLELNFQ